MQSLKNGDENKASLPQNAMMKLDTNFQLPLAAKMAVWPNLHPQYDIIKRLLYCYQVPLRLDLF